MFRRIKNSLSATYIKRFFVALVGGTVLLLGIALIVLPGPAVIVIPAGLAILATEFAWARRWLHHSRHYLGKATDKAKSTFRRRKKPLEDDPSRPKTPV